MECITSFAENAAIMIVVLLVWAAISLPAALLLGRAIKRGME